MNTSILTSAIAVANTLVYSANQAIAQAYENRRTVVGRASTSILDACDNPGCDFTNPETPLALKRLLPQLFVDDGRIPSDLDLPGMVEWIEYTLSIGKSGPSDIVPFMISHTQQVQGLSRRGGPGPGESWTSTNDETTLTYGYLKGLHLEFDPEGQQPKVRIESHRYITTTVDLNSLSASIQGNPVGEIRSGEIASGQYPNLLYALFGPALSHILSRYRLTNDRTTLLIGDQFTGRFTAGALEYQQLVRSMVSQLEPK